MAANHSGGVSVFKSQPEEKHPAATPKTTRLEGKLLTDKNFVVLSTAPDDAVAARLAQALVSEGLAACVSRLPGLRSTYRWQGRICDETEVLLLIKTSGARLATLCARLEALHPYEVPEVIALPIVAGAERYLGWLGQTGAVPGPDQDRAPGEGP